MPNVVYFLGAGASANALPVVSEMKNRLRKFQQHITWYHSKYKNGTSSYIVHGLPKICNEIDKHYTVDTYAKKLYLKGSDNDYGKLLSFLSAFFIYEQLKIDSSLPHNELLSTINRATSAEETKILNSIKTDLDYRYESFFASILRKSENGDILIPPDIKVISWNYDFQIEKGLMNFTGYSLHKTLNELNVRGINHDIDFTKRGSHSFLTKINGTAAFAKDGFYTDLFDFTEHTLNPESLDLICDLLDNKTSGKTGLRFAWEETPEGKNGLEYARTIMEEADLIVVIGYSFQYFNRGIDRILFNFKIIIRKE